MVYIMSSTSWFKRIFGSKPYRPDRSGTPNTPALRIPQTRANPLFPRFKGFSGESIPRAAGGTGLRALLSRAFTPAQPVSELGRFAGRTALLDRMISAVEDQGMHLVVFGDRGIGKTSLLHVLSILARDARYLVRYASCSESSTFDSLFRAVARDVPLLYHSDYDPSSPEVERDRSLADVLGDAPVTPASLSEELAKLTGTKLLIVLDEFDRSPGEGFREKVAELIKNLSDRSARVQLVIGGVALNLSELVSHIPSIRRNVLGIAVSGMTEEELSQIVDNGEAIGKFAFEQAARKLLIQMSNGSPYLVGLLGQYAARTASERQSRQVSTADLDSAVQLVLEDMQSRLSPAAADQLTYLQDRVPEDTLLAAGRAAQTNFGALPVDLEGKIVSCIGGRARTWANAEGGFTFCDDSIPQILALRNWPSSDPA